MSPPTASKNLPIPEVHGEKIGDLEIASRRLSLDSNLAMDGNDKNGASSPKAAIK